MRLARIEDVIHIHNAMWDRGREELKHLGIGKELWFAGWVFRVQRGDAISFGPHALLGWDYLAPKVVTSHFQAARSFEEPGVGREVTKQLRKAIPQLLEGRGVQEINTYSLCVDPSAAKWFRLLGLIEDPNYQGPMRGEYRMRRFVRRS